MSVNRSRAEMEAPAQMVWEPFTAPVLWSTLADSARYTRLHTELLTMYILHTYGTPDRVCASFGCMVLCVCL